MQAAVLRQFMKLKLLIGLTLAASHVAAFQLGLSWADQPTVKARPAVSTIIDERIIRDERIAPNYKL